MSAQSYIDAVKELIQRIETTQMEKIEEVAGLVTETILKKHFVYLFGAGHSSLLALECFDRAGGLAIMQAMLDSGLDYQSGSHRQGGFERLPGYVNCIIGDYDIQEGDVVIVISNSGRNPAPVQMALEAKKLGAVVVALVSLEHSNAVSSNDPSGKKLVEIADIVIDNGCPAGDAMISLPGFLPKVGPGSTVAGATILNAIISQAAKNTKDSGQTPPVFFSGNLPDGNAYNQEFTGYYKDLKKRMKHS